MATLTWVGGTATWDTTTTAVWSPAQVPTAADDVVFSSVSTYTVTMTGALLCRNITVSAGTVTFATGTAPTLAISGSMSLVSGTVWSSTGAITFNATTAQTITTNGTTINANVTLNGVGGSWQLLSAFAMDASNTLTLRNGTFDGNNQSISGMGTFTTASGSMVIKNINATTGFIQNGGTLTQGGPNIFSGTFNFVGTTLNLASYTLTMGAFTSSNSTTRTLAFGTGNITCTGTSATPWNMSAITGFTSTGTPIANINNTPSTTLTMTVGALSEANSISFVFGSSPSAGLSFLANSGETARNVDFSGFTGTWVTRTLSSTIYGSLTLSSTISIAGGTTGAIVFGATSGTQIITTNGATLAAPVTINGIGGTVQLADALGIGGKALVLTNGTFDGNSKTISGASSITMTTGSIIAKSISTAIAFTHTSGTLTQGADNSTGAYTFTAGTLDLASYIFTTTTFANSNANVRTLALGTGTLKLTGSGATAFSASNITNLTVTGSATAKISMTSASAKTFVGGGATYNCILSNDGAGALTITGSNTFTTIANGVQPTTFTFTAATTTTVTNWNVRGTAGNLVTIGSVTAANHTLTKLSGTVSADYLSISRSTATPSTLTWYAGANSTNGGNNTGWIFTAPPGSSPTRSFGWIIT
jgi:hypothetical protein